MAAAEFSAAGDPVMMKLKHFSRGTVCRNINPPPPQNIVKCQLTFSVFGLPHISMWNEYFLCIFRQKEFFVKKINQSKYSN